MNLNEWLRNEENVSFADPVAPRVVIRKHLKCKDGLTLSVQASEYHYCSPRSAHGPYKEVEVGFPSEKIPGLLEYAEDPDRPKDTVYGHVPVGIVEEIIEEHGGIDDS